MARYASAFSSGLQSRGVAASTGHDERTASYRRIITLKCTLGLA